jgi:hypothetical protein
MKHTNYEIAQSWNLWCDYVDPKKFLTEDEWAALDLDARLSLMRDCGFDPCVADEIRDYCTHIVIGHVDSPEVQEWALEHPGEHLCDEDNQWDLAHVIAREYPMWSFALIRHFVAVAAAEFGSLETDLDVEEDEQEKAHEIINDAVTI